jgi:hypothetical protein
LYVVKNSDDFYSENELNHWTKVAQTFSLRLERN